MDSSAIRIIVVDDYAIVRQGIIDILEKEDDISVVGEAADLEQAIALYDRKLPHVVLLDTTLGDTDIITAIRLLHSRFQDIKIIAVADQSERNCAVLRGERSCRISGGMSGKSDCVVSSIRAGAKGAIRLSDTTTELVSAIRAVRAGRFWVDGGATARVMESLFSEQLSTRIMPDAGLTAREDLICRLIADGLSNKEIAARLCIAQQTVKNHVSAILRKSGLEDRLQIARAILIGTDFAQQRSSQASSEPLLDAKVGSPSSCN